MVRFPGDAKQKSRKNFLEKRNFTFFQFFTVPLSKKRKTTQIISWIRNLNWNETKFSWFCSKFRKKNWVEEQNFLQTIKIVQIKHRWFSGRIVACHAIDPGSIPGRCIAEIISVERAVLNFCNLLLFHCQKKRKAIQLNSCILKLKWIESFKILI